MADAIPATAARRPFRPSFFFWMTVVMALFVFAGFSFTYWQPMAAGTLASLPPIVHLHGLFYFSWMLLLIVQAGLINARRVQLHRSLGTFGIALASGMIVLGALITALYVRWDSADPAPDSNSLTYLSLTALLGFGTLFCLAVRNTRKPESHKRLVLFATINLLPPGINRLYMASLGLATVPMLATYLTLDALATAVLIHDWRANGKITAASSIGTAFVVVPQLLYPAIVDSAAFAGLSRLLEELAYYR